MNRTRIQRDVTKLMRSHHEVSLESEKMNAFKVTLRGPADTPYEGGIWDVRVELLDEYPYKSPSIRFLNRIVHPNVDVNSGSVCLDVINQEWSPMYDMLNVFDVFLPQLLAYPNAMDPLNRDAAALLRSDPRAYGAWVRDEVHRWASAPLRDASAGLGRAERAESADVDIDAMFSDYVPSDEE